MDLFKIIFPVSGVETYLFIPPLVAFIISFIAVSGGVSGAFFILPFQMSWLGFMTPSVSSTNFLYNIVGIPGGVYRYILEKRMSWALTWVIVSGTLPGVVVGYYVRIRYFPDPEVFKLFVGLVLLYVGFRVLKSIKQSRGPVVGSMDKFIIKNTSYSLKKIEYDFMDERISFSVPAMFILALVVGVIGGIYGIGGGAIIAPFCVSIFKLPVYTVAGAALMGTLITSIAGVAVYSLVSFNGAGTAPPDWWLGILFGLGGLVGMYFGAKVQRYMPERLIKIILTLIIFLVSGKYIFQFIAE
jgi:uncharacterized membrane protein YfcA